MHFYNYNNESANAWWTENLSLPIYKPNDKACTVESLLKICTSDSRFNELIYSIKHSLFLTPFSSFTHPILLSKLHFTKDSPLFLTKYIGGIIPHLIPNCTPDNKEEPLLLSKQEVDQLFSSLGLYKSAHIEYILSCYCAMHLEFSAPTLHFTTSINYLSSSYDHSMHSLLSKFKNIANSLCT
jgi:hypothetical protein